VKCRAAGADALEDSVAQHGEHRALGVVQVSRQGDVQSVERGGDLTISLVGHVRGKHAHCRRRSGCATLDNANEHAYCDRQLAGLIRGAQKARGDDLGPESFSQPHRASITSDRLFCPPFRPHAFCLIEVGECRAPVDLHEIDLIDRQ